MKVSFFITVASLICLLLPQAHAKVTHQTNLDGEIQVEITNKGEHLPIYGTVDSDRAYKQFAQQSSGIAIEENDDEMRRIQPAHLSCLKDIKSQTTECRFQLKSNSWFGEERRYLVCEVTDLYKCVPKNAE